MKGRFLMLASKSVPNGCVTEGYSKAGALTSRFCYTRSYFGKIFSDISNLPSLLNEVPSSALSALNPKCLKATSSA